MKITGNQIEKRMISSQIDGMTCVETNGEGDDKNHDEPIKEHFGSS